MGKQSELILEVDIDIVNYIFHNPKNLEAIGNKFLKRLINKGNITIGELIKEEIYFYPTKYILNEEEIKKYLKETVKGFYVEHWEDTEIIETGEKEIIEIDGDNKFVVALKDFQLEI